MGVGAGLDIKWPNEDFGQILDHQLSTLLIYDLVDPNDRIRELEGSSSDVGNARLRTFGDLLVHPKPPYWLLDLVKEFAKTADRRWERPLPSEVATVLYYSVIGVAILRGFPEISSLNGSDLLEGFTWGEQQSFAPPEVRQLLTDARRHCEKML
jgi:hypothetical protein